MIVAGIATLLVSILAVDAFAGPPIGGDRSDRQATVRSCEEIYGPGYTGTNVDFRNRPGGPDNCSTVG